MSQVVKRQPNPVGRPPKIDETLVNRVVESLLKCHTQKSAAVNAGISEKTFYNYIEKANEIRYLEENDPDSLPLTPWDHLYLTFLEAIEAAESEVQNKLLGRIDKAGLDKWQANAWILERRWPEEFSTRQTVRHEGTKGGPVEFTLNIPGMDAIETDEEEPELIEGEIIEDE